MRYCGYLHRRRGGSGACAEKFAEARASAYRSRSRPAGVTAPRRWTWTRPMPKAVWGFNGTERPGAVYLAAVLSGHSQKGLPAFGIYGAKSRMPATRPSRPTCRASSCGSPRRGWPWRHARQVVPVDRRACRWGSPARSSTSRSSRIPRHAGRVCRHDRIRPADRRRHLRSGRVRAGAAWVEEQLQGRQGLQSAGICRRRRGRRTRTGRRSSK